MAVMLLNFIDRHLQAQILSKRLDEFTTARRKLVLQLEELDRQSNSVQREYNALHNFDAPISSIPDEVLVMIFDMVSYAKCGIHLGTTLSHVTRSWRSIALATPQLWSDIRFIGRNETKSFESDKEQKLAFIARSKSLPLEIGITGFHLLGSSQRLLVTLLERCHHLRIKEPTFEGLEAVLDWICSCSIPSLISLHLTSEFVITFPERVFPHGAPILRIARVDALKALSIHLCLPAFKAVTTLRLRDLNIHDDENYEAMRNFLMALQALTHLELHVSYCSFSSTLSIILPTIQFLHVDVSMFPDKLGTLIFAIHAKSLVTFSLAGWNEESGTLQVELSDLSGVDFSSVKHLILLDILAHQDSGIDEELDLFTKIFPNIDRLTCSQVNMSPIIWDVEDLIKNSL